MQPEVRIVVFVSLIGVVTCAVNLSKAYQRRQTEVQEQNHLPLFSLCLIVGLYLTPSSPPYTLSSYSLSSL